MNKAGEDYSWLVMALLGLGQLLMFALWVVGGWLLAGGGGAGAAALAWWLVGTGLDWLGFQLGAHQLPGHWEFQPLTGALAGWTLPVILLGGLALLGGGCWGLILLLGLHL